MTLNLTKGGAFEFDSSEARFSQVKPPSQHLLWAWWLITYKVQLAKNHHHHKLLPTTTQQQQLNVSSSSSRPGNPCDAAAGYFHRPTGGKSSEGGRRTKILIYISRFGQEFPFWWLCERRIYWWLVGTVWYSVPNTCCKVTAGGGFEDNGMVGRLSWLVHCCVRVFLWSGLLRVDQDLEEQKHGPSNPFKNQKQLRGP